MFVDGDNNPHIAFGTMAGHAAIASRTRDTWAVEEIFGSGALRAEVEERVWFEIDSAGNPHIAFIAMGGTAFHGVRLDGSWTFTELPTSRFNEPGGVGGLAFRLHPGRLNPELKDTPHIITSDQTTDALVYLRLVDGVFKRVVMTEPVDLSGDGDFTSTGLHSSMMFDDGSETIQTAYVEEAADNSRIKSRRILEPGGESFSNEFLFDNGRFFVAATSVFSGFETWIADCNLTDGILNVAANVSGLDITEKVADVQGRMVPSMARNKFLGGGPEGISYRLQRPRAPEARHTAPGAGLELGGNRRRCARCALTRLRPQRQRPHRLRPRLHAEIRQADGVKSRRAEGCVTKRTCSAGKIGQLSLGARDTTHLSKEACDVQARSPPPATQRRRYANDVPIPEAEKRSCDTGRGRLPHRHGCAGTRCRRWRQRHKGRRAERNCGVASNSVVYVDVAGANVVVGVPAGQTRLFVARFAGESQCAGAAAAPQAYCSLQIIATDAAGVSVPFDPASGLDYAFDSNPPGAADDLWESNAMERSKRLRAGTYRIRLQRAVTNNQTFFRLDDWHFSVETRI